MQSTDSGTAAPGESAPAQFLVESQGPPASGTGSRFLRAASLHGKGVPARQALLATLFRPAMVGGKPVRMLVRIPYEFAIRNGTGRAR